MGVLTKENVIKYKEKGMSDREIAKQYYMDKTTVAYFRKMNNIDLRSKTYNGVLDQTIKKLKKLGFKVEKEHYKNKNVVRSLLLNDSIRVKVKSAAKPFGDYFKYSLSDPRGSLDSESNETIQLENGRYRELYRKTCDYLIFCGDMNNRTFYWIIPTKHIEDNMQSLSLPIYSKRSKYSVYKEAWHLLV